MYDASNNLPRAQNFFVGRIGGAECPGIRVAETKNGNLVVRRRPGGEIIWQSNKY